MGVSAQQHPPVERFRFVLENDECEKCNDKFVNEANVMIHIRSVHEKEVRKMFVIDASEHLEADGEYHMGQIPQDGNFGQNVVLF